MKKIFLMCAVVLGLSACNNDYFEDTDNVIDIKTDVLNHFSPLEADEDPFVGESEYSFSLNMDTKELSFWTSELGATVANGFTSSIIGFNVSTMSAGDAIGEVISFNKQGAASVKDGPVTDIAGSFTTLYYVKENVIVPGYPVLVEGARRLVMNYNLADKYTVHTFPSDAFYGGITETVDGSNTTFTTDKMLYRLIINPKNNKANIILYDCRFSDKMPMSLVALVLENLDFKVTKTGYEVNGENIVPKYLEGNSLTQFRGFIFETVNLKSTDADLTSIRFNYDVRNAGSNSLYKGTFLGSYVID